MTIQINTDKTISGEKRTEDFFTSQIEEALERFESHITRVEVHLKDENGKKDGFNDISCLLEARLEGRQPIAVTNQADTIDLALTGAIDKIKNAVESILGKIQKH
ncbi:HPF/RaiA family ribosome-associated protein [Subsaximicrobium wynnwilliamsii]|jgi:ribosome-associated translation inhibitor RaiA|uniref:HPF/RaiA family ribosome-associated protein n=1 Tax=Subsaximicrobium wynnwilliamsii TaxID=291179 RepID=A0A5C6ZJ03_9FLAO|nr:HPF/RaiA family ribosome-associated protein [Subsaximicrobium wynnwilliamsii]TXD84040.1 HPF/RaiA family ribosome-associated protein [Subsaximicrobium wynnwilliamsii]TXD89002.1 HPF/RaiA family ribosome-associated protein [Subsaximicrobium wynnwilliamsii]TXE03752.1 HPF/RaiA family ribosome-associated protein [Subsaximicrobium wynnwilliamsii]